MEEVNLLIKKNKRMRRKDKHIEDKRDTELELLKNNMTRLISQTQRQTAIDKKRIEDLETILRSDYPIKRTCLEIHHRLHIQKLSDNLAVSNGYLNKNRHE